MTYSGKTAYNEFIASKYDEDRITESIWQKEQDWVANYLTTVPDDAKVLDLPVGTGRFLELYAQKKLKIFGFDISGDMINVSQQNLRKISGKTIEVILQVSDAEKIDLESNSVDYIICFRLFHLIPFTVIKKILSEFYRVSDKQVVIEIFDSSFIKQEQFHFLNFLRKTYHGLKTAFKREPQPEGKPWYHITNYSYDYDKLYREFSKAGFREIIVDKISDHANPVTIFTLCK